MELVDPLDKNHWGVISLAVLEHGADLLNKSVKIKYYVSVESKKKVKTWLLSLLGREAGKDSVFDFFVDFFGKFFDFVVILGISAANQCDDIVENSVKMSVFEDLFSVALGNVENGVTSRNLNLRILIWLQTVYNWGDHVVQEFNNSLV